MSIAKAEDIAFVKFRAPDIGEMRSFIQEFGLNCFEEDGRLYGKATDGAPFAHVTEPGPAGFAALGFRAGSRSDLEALAERDAVPVEPVEGPGGGFVVSLTDPDNNTVEVVAGQTWAPVDPAGRDFPFNSVGARQRLRRPIRYEAGPSHVHRLGHVALMVKDFAVSERWYKERLGLITSDQIEVEAGKPLGAFLRCDRGDTPTDHHSLVMFQATEGGPGFNHAAFEVSGLDDLMVGHAHLKGLGRRHARGVGRHILGSQIYDYWMDPWGHQLEHWTDGDRFSASDGPGVAGLDELMGVLWKAVP